MHDPLEDVQVELPSSGTAVVIFTGEHDLATREPVEQLLGSLIEENDHVVVDFSEANFIDSSMIHALFKADAAARLRGSTFRLQLGAAPIVRKAFELSGILEQLDCAPTREEALRKDTTIRSERAQSPVRQQERDRTAWNLPLPQPSLEPRESPALPPLATGE